MAKPRVVILSAFVSPRRSGAEACAEEVAERLKDQFDVTIVAARMDKSVPKEGTLESGVRVLRVGMGKETDKWLYPSLAAMAVRRLKPDLIHAVLESFAGLALVKCAVAYPKAKRILTCQSTNTSLLLGVMHKAAHAVTVISTPLKKRAEELGRKDAVLIPNGVDVEALRAAADRTPMVPGRILFVGRLEPMKGVDNLLQAMAVLKDDERWTLHIVGDGSLRDVLRRQAKALGLGDRARFFGRLTGPLLWNEYAEASVFCGLSRSEALGNVFIEAQAAGCAVVATRTGGIPDVIQDGVTGLLVLPDDPEAAAAAVKRLMDDKGLRSALGEAGARNARDYGWDGIAARYAEVYRSVLAA